MMTPMWSHRVRNWLQLKNILLWKIIVIMYQMEMMNLLHLYWGIHQMTYIPPMFSLHSSFLLYVAPFQNRTVDCKLFWLITFVFVTWYPFVESDCRLQILLTNGKDKSKKDETLGQQREHEVKRKIEEGKSDTTGERGF